MDSFQDSRGQASEKVFIVEENGDYSEVIDQLNRLLSQVHVILFDGHLGAGKTTLIKAFIHTNFGVEDATSPTFSVINLHKVKTKSPWHSIAHMDLYRLKDGDEFFELGGPEYLDDPGCLCLVEWPEAALAYLDEFALVRINQMEDGSRKLVLSLETVNEAGYE